MVKGRFWLGSERVEVAAQATAAVSRNRRREREHEVESDIDKIGPSRLKNVKNDGRK